jgi:hypothetical protein
MNWYPISWKHLTEGLIDEHRWMLKGLAKLIISLAEHYNAPINSRAEIP